MTAVQFDYDLVGHTAERWAGADRGGEHESAACGHVAGFDDRPMDGTQMAIADGLRHHRQVQIEELHLAFVDERAQFGLGLVGGAEADSISAGKCTVERRSGGRTSHHPNPEFAPYLVFRCGAFCKGERYGFCRTCGCESAKTNGLTVLEKRSRFGRRQLWKRGHFDHLDPGSLHADRN